MSEADLQRQINDLTQQIGALRQQISNADSPFGEVFLATVDGKQWQERTMVETASADFTGGRKCTADTQDSAIIELLSNEAVLMEIKGSTSLNEQTTRYVKVGGGDPVLSGTGSIGSTGETEAADTVSASDCDDKTSFTAVKLYRMSYNHAGDKTLYGYYRTETFVGGKLTTVSAETRVAIDGTEPC